MPTLADSLALVAPSLSPELVPAGVIPRLGSVAATLPPIHRAGFECRLCTGDDQVDFQQGITSADGEPARLAASLGSASPLGAEWERAHQLSQRWATPNDVIHETVSELWFELDMTAPGDRSRPDLHLPCLPSSIPPSPTGR